MAFHTSLLEPHMVSKSGMNVFDPATGESITQVRVYSAAEVEEIISAADSAKSEWADLTAKARAAILKKWND